MIHQTEGSLRQLRFAAGLTVWELERRTGVKGIDLFNADKGISRLTSEQWVTVQHLCSSRIDKFTRSQNGQICDRA